MLEIETIADLPKHIGQKLGTSDWLVVDQKMIDQFAEATGDHQWIHIDVERAKSEMPGGKTIAHGYLTLSLLPKLNQGIWRVKKRSRGVNYGSNKVRFTAPVPAGSRVRGHLTLQGRGADRGRRPHHHGSHRRGRGQRPPGPGRRDPVAGLRVSDGRAEVGLRERVKEPPSALLVESYYRPAVARAQAASLRPRDVGALRPWPDAGTPGDRRAGGDRRLLARGAGDGGAGAGQRAGRSPLRRTSTPMSSGGSSRRSAPMWAGGCIPGAAATT